MRKTTYTCDIHNEEIKDQEISLYQGTVLKMDEEGKMQRGAFEWHFCAQCTQDLIKHIEKQKDASNTNS